MESNSADVPPTKGSTDVEAAGKTREQETNAPNLFKAPRAAEERETNAPWLRETAKNTGTRETNVSEKEAAAVRRDGGPLTIAEQQLRQEASAASKPPNQIQEEAAIMAVPQTAGPDPGDGAKTRGCQPNIPDTSRAGTPVSQASRGGSASRRRCMRRQLTQMLKEGSGCFNPDEVRRIIQAARAGPEVSLTAICMLDDDISLFMHAFPDADDRELRAHCLSTLLEYEESMRAWEEAKDSGEFDSDGSNSEDEDELTGVELLRDLDPPAPCPPADAAPRARSGWLEWPKKVLQQTNLVSSIAAEIELNINLADWDADCYKGCRKLFLRETQRIGTVSDDRGPEEIPALVELEVQQWVDEALRNAARATDRILDRVASMGARHPDQDREEAGDFDLADSKAAQTMMRAVTAYPPNDAQLERIVKLALGKRVLEVSTATAGRDLPRATTSAVRPVGGLQAGPEVMSDDGSESHGTDCTDPEGPPLAGRVTQPTPPRTGEAAALKPSEAPTAQQPGGSPPNGTATTIQNGKKKSGAARRAAKAALEIGSGTPAADGKRGPLYERPRQCPVFGCTREHDPGDCPTFLDMTPKERLDMVHAKQLCLLCLQHPLSVGCEVAGKGFCCPAEGCDRPHHETLHGVLKAGEPSLPEGKADPPGEPTVSVDCGTPEAARQLRGLLEGLGIDPNALEVRIGVRQPGEPGRLHGNGTTGPGATEAGVGRLTGRLMEALTSLCQAGERFVDTATGGGQRMLGVEDPVEIPRRSARMVRSGSATGSMGCTPARNSDWMERQEPIRREREDDIGMMGERRRALESSEYVRGDQGSLERYGGLPRVVLLTPEGGQLINIGIGRGFVFSVISQKTAARYVVHRSKLPAPVMVAGPAGQQVHVTEHCTMAFPQEKAVGGKLVIYAFVVDTLEELHETPGGGLQRWQMQLGEEDEGYLQWLRVAQPGDRPFCELSLEEVTLDPERVSRSTWRFLVCKGRQMTETVWLTAVRAWNMPVSPFSADAATRLGLTERPNDWCQVRPCDAAGRQQDGFLAKIASVSEIAPPRVSDGEEAAGDELSQGTGRLWRGFSATWYRTRWPG